MRHGTGLKAIVILSASGLASGAWAQGAPAPTPAPAPATTVIPGAKPTVPIAAPRTTGDARRDTLVRMSKRITVETTDQKLEDVIAFIKELTQAEIEPVWRGDNQDVGLDKEKRVTVNIRNRSALDALETILEKTKSDIGQGNTWQLSSHGSLQIGPKEAFAKDRRLHIYDINDLLFEIKTYGDVPEIDLNSVLQQGQGGGQSPFNENQTANDQNRKTREQRGREILDLIISIVEPEAWSDNGGDAATVRYYNGTLIVNAPDYVHRQIAGYPFWPSHSASTVNGRRYVSLDMNTGLGKVDGFAPQPVTAVVPGAGGGRGGGGR